MGVLSHSLELQGGGKAGATARAGQILLHDAMTHSILMRRLLWKPMCWQMRTVRWRFQQIAGVVATHARRSRLKVPGRYLASLRLWRRTLYEQLAY